LQKDKPIIITFTYMNVSKKDRTPLQIQKHAKGLCCNAYCKHLARPKRWDCNTCHTKKNQIRNPLRYSYNTLKNNAKRRGKDFTLTFDQFAHFAKKIDYMNKKGTKAKSMSIDRRDETRGYHFDNIQGLSLRENIYKYKMYKAAEKLRCETPF
jgi:hypothetical protein